MSARKRPADKLELAKPLTTAKRTKHFMNQPPIAKSLSPAHRECNEPYKLTLKGLGRGWSYNHGLAMLTTLQGSMKLLQKCCDTLPPLQSAVEGLLSVLNTIEYNKIHTRILQSVREIESDLVRWTVILAAYLSNTRPELLSMGTEELSKTLREQTEYISEQQVLGQMKQAPETERDLDQFRECFRRIEVVLCRLQSDASLNIWRIEDEQAKVVKLGKLLPVTDARHDSARPDPVGQHGCCPNTRVSILEYLRGWANGVGAEKICWINGMAGTGKTTIAYSVCTELKKNGCLGASFFCSRGSPACEDVARIIPTIAYQLARLSLPFKWALCKVLESAPDIHQRNLYNQFQTLIVAPFLEVKELLPSDLVIVIDGLDECLYPEATKLMLDVLITLVVNLPVRVLVTSRTNTGVPQAILPQNPEVLSTLCLDTIKRKLVEDDIATYLQSSLAGIIPSEDVELLAKRADGLFIYASTAVKYIKRGLNTDPQGRLEAILAVSNHPKNGSNGSGDEGTSIDSLYGRILEEALNGQAEKDQAGLQTLILWTVLRVKEPMTLPTLARLINVDYELLQGVLAPLTCVLGISEGSQVLTTLHASFSEYMHNSSLGSRWLKGTHDLNMARRCFDIMKEQLRFNICGLETSYALDMNVPDLQTRVKTCIPVELSYACRYWAAHLADSPNRSEASESACLSDFLSHRLLFWMEVLNLTGLIDYGPKVLMAAQGWLSDRACSSELYDSLSDALSFVTIFAASPAHLSTPHIYISVLPLISKESKIWENYGCRTRGLLHIHSTYTSQDQVLIHAATPMEDSIVGTSWIFGAEYIPHESKEGETVVYTPSGLDTPISSCMSCSSKLGRTSPHMPRAFNTGSISNDVTLWLSSAYLGEESIQSPQGPPSSFTPIHMWLDGATITSGPNDTACSFDACHRPLASSFLPQGPVYDYIREVGVSSNDYIVSIIPYPTQPCQRDPASALFFEMPDCPGNTEKQLHILRRPLIVPHTEGMNARGILGCSYSTLPAADNRVLNNVLLAGVLLSDKITSNSKGDIMRIWNTQTKEIIDPIPEPINHTKLILLSYDAKSAASLSEFLRIKSSTQSICMAAESSFTPTSQPNGNAYTVLSRNMDKSAFLPTNSYAIIGRRNCATGLWLYADGLKLSSLCENQGAAVVEPGFFSPLFISSGSSIWNNQMLDPFLEIAQLDRNEHRGNRPNTVLLSHNKVVPDRYNLNVRYRDSRQEGSGEDATPFALFGDSAIYNILESRGRVLRVCDTRSDAQSPAIPQDQWEKSANRSGHSRVASDVDKSTSMQGPQDYNEWRIDEQGWIVDTSSRHLFWIPEDLRRVFLSPKVLAVISGAINHCHAGIFVGEYWNRCYEQGG